MSALCPQSTLAHFASYALGYLNNSRATSAMRAASAEIDAVRLPITNNMSCPVILLLSPYRPPHGSRRAAVSAPRCAGVAAPASDPIAVVGGDGRRIITKRVMTAGTQVDALRLVGQFLDKWAPGCRDFYHQIKTDAVFRYTQGYRIDP
jgi:hypothetical protein